MADGQPKMVFLGFGKYVRADRIYALEPIRGDERGGGRRTRVWVDGIPDPVIASRTERAIILEMGERDALAPPIVDEAIALARRIVEDAERGRVDLGDLARRARRLLEATVPAGDPDQLF